MANEKCICKQCVHYLVCMHYSATRKECKQFQANTNYVEVVRCKDCKICDFSYPAKPIGEEAIPGWYCKKYRCYRKPDDFCSYGERKDNG